MWSINSLVDDGLPDRIPTGLTKSLLPLAVVLAIHDINISHAQMADNTLSLHSVSSTNFQHIPTVFHHEAAILQQ